MSCAGTVPGGVTTARRRHPATLPTTNLDFTPPHRPYRTISNTPSAARSFSALTAVPIFLNPEHGQAASCLPHGCATTAGVSTNAYTCTRRFAIGQTATFRVFMVT